MSKDVWRIKKFSLMGSFVNMNKALIIICILSMFLAFSSCVYIYADNISKKRMICARDMFQQVMVDELEIVREDVASKEEAGNYFDNYISHCLK